VSVSHPRACREGHKTRSKSALALAGAHAWRTPWLRRRQRPKSSEGAAAASASAPDTAAGAASEMASNETDDDDKDDDDGFEGDFDGDDDGDDDGDCFALRAGEWRSGVGACPVLPRPPHGSEGGRTCATFVVVTGVENLGGGACVDGVDGSGDDRDGDGDETAAATWARDLRRLFDGDDDGGACAGGGAESDGNAVGGGEHLLCRPAPLPSSEAAAAEATSSFPFLPRIPAAVVQETEGTEDDGDDDDDIELTFEFNFAEASLKRASTKA